MWLEKLEWDEVLPERIQTKLDRWLNDLKYLEGIKFRRWLGSQDNVKQSIHIFVDSSETAYASVAYLRTENLKTKRVHCNIIAAKTKVSPLIWTSMPRLELMGSMLGLKLSEKVRKALDIEEITYWTDSRNVLGWIKNRSHEFKPFIAQRVSNIQQMSDIKNWRYVPSSENPADIWVHGRATHEEI